MYKIDDLPLFAKSKDSVEYDFIDDLKSFCDFGANTLCYTDEDIKYYVNEFWTSKQRQSAPIHEISYRACFKAQLPEFFIARLSKLGDCVYDPFMGRGTTLVQANLMGRFPVGNDINPLSKLITRPRLAPPRITEITKVLSEINWNDYDDFEDELLAFYHLDTLKEILALKKFIKNTAPIELDSPNPVIDWIRMVAINRLSGHSPGFFSIRSMPPNQSVSIKSQIRINEKLGQKAEYKNVASIILNKSKSLLKGMAINNNGYKILTGDAAHAESILDNSISLVITSPPFLDIVQYSQDNWLRCWFAGIDVDKVNISMHKKEGEWINMVHLVLKNLSKKLKTGGHIAFEVGEVRGGKVLLEKLVWKAAEGLPFKRLGVMINKQEFTKTANCWGVSNNKSGTNSNRIVILQKL